MPLGIVTGAPLSGRSTCPMLIFCLILRAWTRAEALGTLGDCLEEARPERATDFAYERVLQR
eukprot:6369088-Heterocapsa_arctica.AAC.1